MLRLANKTLRVYVSLDTLLDTRLGCLAENFKDDTPKYLKDYSTRKFERFGDLSCKDFRKLYKKRTKAVLSNSIITNIQDLLAQIAVVQAKENLSGPESIDLVIELNTYPYVLTEAEQKKIKSVVHFATGKLYSGISVVNIPDKDLTPSYFKNSFVAIFMYGYADWFQYHSEKNNFKDAIIPEIAFIVPEVYFYDDEDEDQFSKTYTGKNILDVVEAIMAPFVGITFYQISNFCALPLAGVIPRGHPG